MDDCSEVRSELDAHLRGELSFELSAAIEEHLNSCASCRAESENVREISVSVRRLGLMLEPVRPLVPQLTNPRSRMRSHVARVWVAAALAWTLLATAAVFSPRLTQWLVVFPSSRALEENRALVAQERRRADQAGDEGAALERQLTVVLFEQLPRGAKSALMAYIDGVRPLKYRSSQPPLLAVLQREGLGASPSSAELSSIRSVEHREPDALRLHIRLLVRFERVVGARVVPFVIEVSRNGGSEWKVTAAKREESR